VIWFLLAVAYLFVGVAVAAVAEKRSRASVPELAFVPVLVWPMWIVFGALNVVVMFFVGKRGGQL